MSLCVVCDFVWLTVHMCSRADKITAAAMYTSISYAFLGCLAIVFILKELWRRWVGRLKGFRSPPMHFLLGHSLMFPTDPCKLITLIRDWLVEYNKELMIYLGPHRFFLSGNPDHSEILLSSTKTITKSHEYSFLVPWLGTGQILFILSSTGSKWKTRRRLLTPAFHYGILEDFAEVFQEQSAIFVEQLKPLAINKEKFNICTYATNCTLDIICETAMGVNCGAQVDATTEYPKAVLSMCSIIQYRQIRPYLWPEFIYNLTADGKEHNRSIKILHDFTVKVIKDKIKVRKEKDDEKQPEKKRRAFIDILLDCYEQGEIDLDGLREEVDTFMFEGHDTTAAGVFWTLYIIGRYPDVLKKAQEEVDRVWADAGNKSFLELAKEMTYLTSVIKESLRLFPPVPLFARAVHEDIDLGNGMVLPAGSTFGIATFYLHRNPDHWKDPDEFIPERFLPENSHKRHPFAYVPFSAGPRNCVGQKFALLEEKIVLSNFLRNFNIKSFQAPEDVEVSAEIILRTKSGLMVEISNRS
eukprot:Seg2883.1 transcript_id=Seg2883.1/GoldUCD/mRNA.D3Y31 product="Cytochrome P450 4V2" protein_id=Seg2883.1/GoldUCD/D3Y31